MSDKQSIIVHHTISEAPLQLEQVTCIMGGEDNIHRPVRFNTLTESSLFFNLNMLCLSTSVSHLLKLD